MTNDDTRPLPAEGAPPARAEGPPVDGVNGAQPPPLPVAPPSAWATPQPVVPPPPSPYGPPPAYGPPPSVSSGPELTPGAQPAPGWAGMEPDPWLDVTPLRPGDAPAFEDRGPRPPGQGRRLLGIVGLVAAGGSRRRAHRQRGGGVPRHGHRRGAAGRSEPERAGGTERVAPGAGGAQGGVQGGQGLQGGGQGLQGGGQGLQGGAGGQGLGGEQHVIGTLTAVSGSKVTVRTSSGSATYQLVAQTQIVRDGALASASDLRAGDRVLVHVFPANGSDGVLERLIAVSGTGSGRSGTQGNQDGGADT